MKKIFFLLLFPFWGIGGFSAWAQSHINIELLGATYTVPAVQFRVSWDAIPEGACHNAKIWLWVDFIKIENNQPSGTWTRAIVNNPSPGTVAPETDKGFWLQGNSGSYSQTVTVALTNIPANTIFNWCAYASDCPPFVIANNGTYTLQGTPPFILSTTDGTSLTVAENTLPASSLTIAAVTLTDKTECPSFFCAYTGSDLLRDETHLCGHRPTGAQNWQAWIKDTRDEEIYRIVMMPDNNWWLAQNVKLASYNGETVGAANENCTKEECGRAYSIAVVSASYAGGSSGIDGPVQGICPPGWLLPPTSAVSMLIGSLYPYVGGMSGNWAAWLRPLDSMCDVDFEQYAFGNLKSPIKTGVSQWGISMWSWYSSTENYHANFGVNDGWIHDEITEIMCLGAAWYRNPDVNMRVHPHMVRCFRQQ